MMETEQPNDTNIDFSQTDDNFTLTTPQSEVEAVSMGSNSVAEPNSTETQTLSSNLPVETPTETLADESKYSFITDFVEKAAAPFVALNDTIEEWRKKTPESQAPNLKEAVFPTEKKVPHEYQSKVDIIEKPEQTELPEPLSFDKTDIPMLGGSAALASYSKDENDVSGNAINKDDIDFGDKTEKEIKDYYDKEYQFWDSLTSEQINDMISVKYFTDQVMSILEKLTEERESLDKKNSRNANDYSGLIKEMCEFFETTAAARDVLTSRINKEPTVGKFRKPKESKMNKASADYLNDIISDSVLFIKEHYLNSYVLEHYRLNKDDLNYFYKVGLLSKEEVETAKETIRKYEEILKEPDSKGRVVEPPTDHYEMPYNNDTYRNPGPYDTVAEAPFTKDSLEEAAQTAPKLARGRTDYEPSYQFYKEENVIEGVSKETDEIFSRDKRATDRITANGGNISTVAKYIDSLPEEERKDALSKIGKDYYMAKAGDLRAGLSIFAKTGDIIGSGTANRIGDAITALDSGDVETASKLIDENQVGVLENLKSGLWTNNPANKTIATLIGGAIISAAGGAAISKAAEKVVPKIVDKLMSTAFNGEGASQKIAEKIVTSLAKNKNIAKELDMAQKFDDYKDLFESSKYLDELNKTQNIDDAISTIFGKQLDAASSAKRKEEIALFEEMTQTMANTLRNYKNVMGSAEDLGAENLVNLAKELESTFRPAFSNILQNAVAAGKKDALVAVLTDSISENLKKAGDVAKPTAIAAGLATAIVENAEAKIKPEITGKESPEKTVSEIEEAASDIQKVDYKPAQELMKEISAKSLREREKSGEFASPTGQSIRDYVFEQAKAAGVELSPTAVEVLEKIDEIHNSNLSTEEKEEEYNKLEKKYSLSEILQSLGIPVVSSVLKAIDAWRDGDWEERNKASGEEFAQVTNTLKEEWSSGGVGDKISALINAAKGYKAATQNTKMYQALKATQKAVAETLLTALGISSGAAPILFAIMAKNTVSNMIKSASNGETNLDNISEDEWKSAIYETPAQLSGSVQNDEDIDTTQEIEESVPPTTDFKGYNAGLEEEEKARPENKDVPSDVILKVFKKEPKTFAWIRKYV